MSQLNFTRAEYVAILIATSALILIYHQEINWVHFLVSFWLIDIVGYWPGYLVARLNTSKQPSPFYYRLYNTMHNIGVWSLVAAVYVSVAAEPASIVAPFFHLAIDRGVFGNFYKRYPEPFRESTVSLAKSH